MQPPQIVILITTIGLIILVIVAWLVGSSQAGQNDTTLEDNVRSGWYGRPMKQTVRPARITTRGGLTRIVGGVLLLLIGLVVLMPMTTSDDIGEANATVTEVTRVQKTRTKAGISTTSIVYLVSFSYFASGTTCHDFMEVEDSPAPPYAVGQIFKHKYLETMPCMGMSDGGVETIRMFTFMGALLAALFGAAAISLGVFDISTAQHARR